MGSEENSLTGAAVLADLASVQLPHRKDDEDSRLSEAENHAEGNMEHDSLTKADREHAREADREHVREADREHVQDADYETMREAVCSTITSDHARRLLRPASCRAQDAGNMLSPGQAARSA